MKRYAFLAVLAVLVLFTASCDRFTHAFDPPVVTDLQAALFTPLQVAFNTVVTAGIDTVMTWYTDDYLHFGVVKSDRANWFAGIYSIYPAAVATVSLVNSQIQTDSTAVANWRLQISSLDLRTVYADSTFIGERLVKRAGRWLLKGNQMTCQLPVPAQHLVIDYFTFLTCPNCPVVEAKLEELQAAYPDQLSYLEHHFNDQLMIPGNGTQAYYGVFSAPASVIQGKYLLQGNGTDVLDTYDALVEQLAAYDSDFRYTNPVVSVEGQTITGSITLQQLNQELDLTNLALKYVLIERVSQFNNANGNPAKNVVRALGRMNISAADLSAPLLFTLESTVAIPDDASLVIYTQTLPDTFTNDADIHGGVEIALDRSVISFN